MTDLHQVLARFPERANEIRRMCLRDSNFRSICEDLILAYRSAPKDDAGLSAAARELGALREELEAELLAYLDRRQDAGRSRL